MITEHAVQQLGLTTKTAGWLIQTAQPLECRAAHRRAAHGAAAAGLTIETKNDAPTSAKIIDWATVFGILSPWASWP